MDDAKKSSEHSKKKSDEENKLKKSRCLRGNDFGTERRKLIGTNEPFMNQRNVKVASKSKSMKNRFWKENNVAFGPFTDKMSAGWRFR